MKIVRILGRMNIGGPAVHAVLLTEGLNHDQFRSILVSGMIGKSEGNMLYFARQHGVTPLIVPELGREISWRDDLVALWKLYRLLARERPDIVHTHTAKAGALGRVAAVLARVPIRIHTFHGHVLHGYFGPLKTRLFIAIERFLAAFTTKIVAISQTQLVELSDRYRLAAREKFRVIPLGLDLAPLLRESEGDGRRKLGIAGREIVIGLVGRLVPVKNPHMAVGVFERLVRNAPAEQPFRFIVAGDGELRPALQEHVRRAGLEDRVLFTGWHQDLWELYSMLNLAILTSLNEGTPVVLIEAMASGLPFVATRVGGLSDLTVGSEQVMRGPDGRRLFSLFANGALAESGDVEGFAAAVEYLVCDRERMQRMGSEGRRFVSERFSKERLVRDTQELCRECLGQSEGRQGKVCTI